MSYYRRAEARRISAIIACRFAIDYPGVRFLRLLCLFAAASVRCSSVPPRITQIHAAPLAVIVAGIQIPCLIMPTILQELGWRVFFYPNEGNEPIHVHCVKAEKECKFWVDVAGFDLVEEFTLNMSPRDKREIRKILFAHFELIEHKWTEMKRRQQP